MGAQKVFRLPRNVVPTFVPTFRHKASYTAAPTPRSPRKYPLPQVVGASLLTIAYYASFHSTLHADGAKQEKNGTDRLIRLQEVRKHGADAERVWAYRRDGVYDLTDWIPLHPGGGVIHRAAGGDIDAFWNIFTIHKKPEVYEILEEYRIGTLHPQDLVDGRVPASTITDPFTNDPIRDPRLVVHSQKPCNAETPADLLSEFITPNELYYVRNHMWCPVIDNADDHIITVETIDGKHRHYALSELKRLFKPTTITATLQCSGNRRSHMTAASKGTQGLQWGVGAIGTATWTGIRLRDLLAHTGMDVSSPDEDALHVCFSGSEAYGASIPIKKAIDKDGDVLIAYEMNGETLPVDHGYPVRMIVPGHVAARSVKWVNKITVSSEESTSQWQQRDYKLGTPGHPIPYDRAPAIQETPVQSAITAVHEATTLSPEERNLLITYGREQDSIVISGWAMSGGGRAIVRVDVSADGGKTWKEATLDAGPDNLTRGSRDWAWKRWTATYPRTEVAGEFVCKATDEAVRRLVLYYQKVVLASAQYNCQPRDHSSIHNERGNLATAWHRQKYGT